MTGEAWLFRVTFVLVLLLGSICAKDEDVSDAIRSLQEQVNALLDHRQQDYNALEGSLKRAMEKNTELFVLKNEVKQLRKEVNALRGGNGNEAKNERLRVRWLGSAVTELQGEVAEVLRTRNASEELAERSRMRGELAMLKGDVAAVGKGIRNLGGRIAKLEAVLGTIRVDITAVKERFSLLSRTCADIASQLSAVQIEVKSVGCQSSTDSSNTMTGRRGEQSEGRSVAASWENDRRNNIDTVYADRNAATIHHRLARRHGYSRHGDEHRRVRVEDRLKSLERRVSMLSSQRRAMLDAKHIAYESQELPTSIIKRVKSLEKNQAELSQRIANVSENAVSTKNIGESIGSRVLGSLRALEEVVESNNTVIKRELVRLGVNAARKAAELSLTREELSNLRRLELELEKLEDRYHLIVDRLPASCEERSTDDRSDRDGLRLVEPGQGRRPMLVYCREGWIVVARRTDGTLDFDRTWNDYALGFGSPVGEYWIGNGILHELTRDNCTRLRVDLLDIYGERWQAEYDSFAIDSRETGYRLRVGGYTGNATDALSYQNGMSFSAKDRDMDDSPVHCAGNYHGGWWFSRCQHANLNGKYSLGLSWFRSDTSQWMSIASSEMSVRRNPDCRRSR
ncbi:Protein scabrous [Dufourea novaeangliae]|uniref:Protein scabrous n=1 Tax=Dufourea novaeangliae TaxID=178035 RepID=A0A154NYJ1_DUFNO|nr:Protein scabrous [Dufourea novaeangliae]